MSTSDLKLEDLSLLISDIYSAALDETHWQVFVKKLADVSGASHCQAFIFDKFANTTHKLIQHNLDPEFEKSFADYYATKNFWAVRLAELDAGTVCLSDEMISTAEVEKTEFYNDWLKPQEDILRGAAAVVNKSDSRSFLLGVNVRRHDVDGIEQNWVQMTKLLMPHLNQAMEISKRLNLASLQISSSKTAQNLAHQSAFIIASKEREIVYANDAALKLLQKGNVVRLRFGERLSFVDEGASSYFEKVTQQFSLGFSSEHETKLERFFSANYQYKIVIKAVTVNTSVGTMGVLRDENAILISIEGQGHLPDLRALAAKWDITGAELEVLRLYSKSLCLNQIAEERQVSIHTVRNQIKSVMQKLHVNNRFDLLKIIERPF